MLSRSVEYSLRMVYCISLGRLRKKTSFDDGEGGRRLNDPFDPYASLSGLALCRVQLRMVYCISLGRLEEIVV